MKRLVILQTIGCITFTCIMVALHIFGISNTLSAIIVYWIMGVMNVVNASNLLMKPLERLGIHDRLTGCHNRVRLETRIPEYEKHNTYAIIFFDINNFKKVNDTHGHNIGDKLLINASDQLRFWFSYGDLYRLGGDEFIVVVPNMGKLELENLVSNWYIKQPILNALYKDDFECKFSYGMSFKKDNMSFDETMKVADEAMYEMKKAMKAGR